MTRITHRSIVLAAWLLAIGILLPRVGEADRQGRGLAERARDILNRRCYQCHGRNGVAPKNIFVNDRAQLVSSRAVVPGDPGSLLVKMVESGAMPLGGPELSEEEKAALRSWVLIGAPNWGEATVPRTFITESAILAQIRSDLNGAPDRSRAYLRYLSIAHLYNARVPESELEDYRGAMSKLINSLSRHREVTPPVAIDPARTLFRIDLRDYDWTSATWNDLVAAYSYAVRTSDGDSITRISGSPVPYLRGDWFVAKASAPPLYYDILNLPRTVQELERQLGIDADRDLAEEKNVIRAGIRASGVSQNNRILERHVSQHGAYWKSFDFRNNLDDQNIFRDPLRFNAAGSEIIFNLPNGLQAYYLADSRGNRLNSAPINIVADRNNPDDPIIHSGRSCMSCHFAGMRPFKDDVRPVAGSMSLGDVDRDKVLALYAAQDTLDQLTGKDSGRFQTALEKAGARVPLSATTESISALSRRFNAELAVTEAAAEAGLEADEFQMRLNSSPRLVSLGFGQLLVSGGGIKRDVWDRQFGDVVLELRLGDYVPPKAVVTQASSSGPVQLRLGGSSVALASRPAGISTAGPAESLRSARTIFIMTRTVHFKPDDLAGQLLKKPEFTQMGLTVTKDRTAADLIMEVDRITFSTEFPYVIVDPKNRTVVASGQVNSLFGTVPAKIANMFMKQIKQARASTVSNR
jgi:mono/diheme cytochrome c family protein